MAGFCIHEKERSGTVKRQDFLFQRNVLSSEERRYSIGLYLREKII